MDISSLYQTHWSEMNIALQLINLLSCNRMFEEDFLS